MRWLALLLLLCATVARAEYQEIKSECDTWGNGHQHVQPTWDLGMVFIAGGCDESGNPIADREEWSSAKSMCFYDDELVNGQIPEKDRPRNGLTGSCTAQQRQVEEPPGSGTWILRWFYPKAEPFCAHDPYGGWMLCGTNCIYPAEYYHLPPPPMAATATTPPAIVPTAAPAPDPNPNPNVP